MDGCELVGQRERGVEGEALRGANPVIRLDEFPNYTLQAIMIRPQLDLPRRINDHITRPAVLLLLDQPAHLVFQPIEIRLEVLHRIQHRPVRPEGMLCHNLGQGNEVGDVDRARIRRVGHGRVEVDDVDGPVEGGEELVHAVAVGGFAGARWACDELSECGHGGGWVRDRDREGMWTAGALSRREPRMLSNRSAADPNHGQLAGNA